VAGIDFKFKSTIWTPQWTNCGGPGVDFRGDTITGRGGRQALALDPSGNLVELFEAYQG